MARVEVETFNVIVDKKEVYKILFSAESMTEQQETLMTDIFTAMFADKSSVYNITEFFAILDVDVDSEKYEVVGWCLNENDEWIFSVEKMM